MAALAETIGAAFAAICEAGAARCAIATGATLHAVEHKTDEGALGQEAKLKYLAAI